MSPLPSSREGAEIPCVGIPWRTAAEERAGSREKLDYYFAAVRKAGGEPREISLQQPPANLAAQLEALEGFVLPGSPADVDPSRYGAARHLKTQTLDADRDATDEAILRHALDCQKPILAICYGCQMLNVHLGGTLVQDIASERPGSLRHGNTDLPAGARSGDVFHPVTFTPYGVLATLNNGPEAQINSSHHQAIDRLGEGLRVAAQAPDGVIEGVQWGTDSNWVVGAQWHPERMIADPLAERLFAEFVEMVRVSRGVLPKRGGRTR